jgi:hypothetical protein
VNNLPKKPLVLLSGMILTLIATMFYASPQVADDADSSHDEWQFETTPYLFAAGMDGTVEMLMAVAQFGEYQVTITTIVVRKYPFKFSEHIL